MIGPKLSTLTFSFFCCLAYFQASVTCGQEPRLTLNDDGKFAFTAFGQEIRRLEIMSPEHSLIPPESSGPFDFVFSNTFFGPTQTGVTTYFASIDPAAPGVIVDGTIALDVGWNEVIGDRNISFRYGTEAPAGLNLGDGRGVTGRIDENGFIVVTGSGQETLGLDFISPTEALVPFPATDEQGNSLPGSIGSVPPAPFVLTLSNKPDQVTIVALPGDFITLDGDLTLPVVFSGENPGLEIQAQWANGSNTIPFPIEGTIAVANDRLQWSDYILVDPSEYPGAPVVEPPVVIEPPIVEPPVVVDPPVFEPPVVEPPLPIDSGTLVGTFPEGGGLITLTTVGGPVDVTGLDIMSTNGLLVPIPDVNGSTDAGPFTFLLSNTQDQVTFGNLGSTALFEGSITLPLEALPGAELVAAWGGDGPMPISFPITAGQPIVPEPDAGYLLVAGAAVLCALRRRCSGGPR